MKTNIGLALKKRSENSPELEAVVDGHDGARVSYAQLNSYCNQCAASMSQLGVSFWKNFPATLPVKCSSGSSG